MAIKAGKPLNTHEKTLAKGQQYGMNRKILIRIAIAVILLTGIFYGWRWMASAPRQQSAERLAQIALTGSGTQEKPSSPPVSGVPLGEMSGDRNRGRGAEEQKAAAAELVQLGSRAIPQMRQVLRESKSTEVRSQMILGLAQQWDLESMPAFLDAMDDPSLLIRGRAEMAVKKILASVGDYRANDPPERRQEALKAVRKSWDVMQASPRFPLYQERAKANRL